MGARYRLGRLPFEGKGNSMVCILVHGRWCEIRGKAIGVSMFVIPPTWAVGIP